MYLHFRNCNFDYFLNLNIVESRFLFFTHNEIHRPNFIILYEGQWKTVNFSWFPDAYVKYILGTIYPVSSKKKKKNNKQHNTNSITIDIPERYFFLNSDEDTYLILDCYFYERKQNYVSLVLAYYKDGWSRIS